MSSNRQQTRTLRRLLLGTAAASLGIVSPAIAQEKPLPPGMFSVAPGANGQGRPLTANMVLTLDDAINLAQQRQPTIHAAQASLQSALAAQTVANSHMAGLAPSNYSVSSSDPIMALNPPSTCVISAVMPAARSDSKNAATLPTSSIVTLRRKGAALSTADRIFEKPLIPAAASVRIGPAEMPLTRMPRGPRLAAK